jgi:hypothetical protein
LKEEPPGFIQGSVRCSTRFQNGQPTPRITGFFPIKDPIKEGKAGLFQVISHIVEFACSTIEYQLAHATMDNSGHALIFGEG